MTQISFPLQETGMPRAFTEFISANIDEITSTISFSQQDMNDKVEIGEVTVEEVRILIDGVVEIDFQYEWSFFSGCKDIDKQGVEVETIHARISGGSLVFDIADRPEPRTTDEEF